jgi:serine/threonine protein kinase
LASRTSYPSVHLSLLEKGNKCNLTEKDFSGWQLLQDKNKSKVFRRESIILKISDPLFPDIHYEIGRTECIVLKYIEAKMPESRHFPRCLASSKVWINGSKRYATAIPFIKGEPFEDAIIKSNATQLYSIIDSLLSALEGMNEMGITHRDIDARNVLVENLESVKVFDFALATSPVAPAEGRTVGGLGLHKPPDVGLCGFDDLYSAGIMLRQALVKRRGYVPKGIHNIVYHVTRDKCIDRVRDFARLRAILYQYGKVTDTVAPCYDANAHAMNTTVDHDGECLQVTGYQVFKACKGNYVASTNNYLDLRLRSFDGIDLNGTRLMDIGGNSGFYSLWALQHGSLSSVIIEQDIYAISAGQTVADFLSLDLKYTSFQNMKEADIVMAFAIVHWLMSCSQSFGNLADVVYFLRKLTRSTLLVEWIDPLDDAIQTFGHVDSSFSYTRINFEMLLKQYFSSFRFVVKSRDHRYIYQAKV